MLLRSLIHRASHKAAVTLDSTFLFKTASNAQEIVLTSEQLSKYKANYRVRKLDVDNPRNHTGKDLLISVLPARLGLKAAALAWLEAALAFRNPRPGQSRRSRLGPGLARPGPRLF